MERSSGMKKGMKVVAMSFFLAAAAVSMGCGQNALVNPLSESAQGQSASNPSGQNTNPSGQNTNP